MDKNDDVSLEECTLDDAATSVVTGTTLEVDDMDDSISNRIE